jgi:hypothetical protein
MCAGKSLWGFALILLLAAHVAVALMHGESTQHVLLLYILCILLGIGSFYIQRQPASLDRHTHQHNNMPYNTMIANSELIDANERSTPCTGSHYQPQSSAVYIS